MFGRNCGLNTLGKQQPSRFNLVRTVISRTCQNNLLVQQVIEMVCLSVGEDLCGAPK